MELRHEVSHPLEGQTESQRNVARAFQSHFLAACEKSARKMGFIAVLLMGGFQAAVLFVYLMDRGKD